MRVVSLFWTVLAAKLVLASYTSIATAEGSNLIRRLKSDLERRSRPSRPTINTPSVGSIKPLEKTVTPSATPNFQKAISNSCTFERLNRRGACVGKPAIASGRQGQQATNNPAAGQGIAGPSEQRVGSYTRLGSPTRQASFGHGPGRVSPQRSQGSASQGEVPAGQVSTGQSSPGISRASSSSSIDLPSPRSRDSFGEYEKSHIVHQSKPGSNYSPSLRKYPAQVHLHVKGPAAVETTTGNGEWRKFDIGGQQQKHLIFADKNKLRSQIYNRVDLKHLDRISKHKAEVVGGAVHLRNELYHPATRLEYAQLRTGGEENSNQNPTLLATTRTSMKSLYVDKDTVAARGPQTLTERRTTSLEKNEPGHAGLLINAEGSQENFISTHAKAVTENPELSEKFWK